MNRLKIFWQRLLLDNWLVQRFKTEMLMIIYGPINFQALTSAIRFDLFTLLAKKGPLRRSQIAKELNISLKSARNLLTLLLTLKIIKKKAFSGTEDPIYKNTFLGHHYLNKNSPLQITSIIVGWLHSISYKAMFHYYDSLKHEKNIGLKEIPGDEPTLYQRLSHHPELEKEFQQAMHQLSNLANKWVANFIDFSKSKCIMDVGGGDGSTLTQVIKRNPHLKGIVLDSESVCQRTKLKLTQQNMDHKISTFEGDCFKSPFPEEVDTILFCHFLDIWTEEQDQALLKKAYERIPKGGKVIIFDIMEKDNGRGPLSAVITSAYFLTQATGGGYMYSAREYDSWLKGAGFNKVKRYKFPDEHVAIVAEKC